MNTTFQSIGTLITAAAGAAALLLVGCAAPLTKADGAIAARDKLTQLQADPQLGTRAPLAIKEADLAVRAAEEPTQDKALEDHLVFMADRKVDIAWARAQSRLAVDQRDGLSDQRAGARLDARTREADLARRDAMAARSDAASARRDAEMARTQAADLQGQIAELNAKDTDRGLVMTLGDVLFASGRSELKGGAPGNLAKLAVFLKKYEDRTVIIEGHTDSVGSEESNRSLSQRRADTVKAYLVSQDVVPSRLAASGLGEGSPVADNDSATGRQQNRRVEVIISNTVTSLK